MSAELANLMDMCSDIQENAIESTTLLMSFDANSHMKVSTVESFDFIKSLQATGLLFSPDILPSSNIDLGQFVHMNWGRCGECTISYTWCAILENTIGSGE